MITMICLNEKNELELIVASRIGYSHAEKRFWFEMIGRSDVFYYENVESETAAAAMKTALKQDGANLKSFGTYKVKRVEVAHPAPVAMPKSCPKAAEKRAENMSETRVVPPVKAPKDSNAEDVAPAAPRRRPVEAPKGPSFMDRVTKVLDEGVKKAKTLAQEVAVAAEEEDKKDKERSAARRAEWNAKKEALEEKVEERRARRAAAKAAAEADEDEEEIRSEFDEIARGVAEAADKAVEDLGTIGNSNPVPVAKSEAVVEDVDVDVEAEIAAIMANKVASEPTEDELKEITQLNLDFSDIDDVMDDIM